MPGPGRRSTFVGAVWNVASMILPLVSTVALSAVVARHLGTDELGAQSLISYAGSLVSGIVVIAATNCTIQVIAAANGAGDDARVTALARLSGRMHVAGGLVAGLALGSLGLFRDHLLAWVLIGLVTALDALGWSHGSRLVARHGWRSVSPLRMVSQFAASLAGVGAVLLGAGIAGVFGAQALASAWLALTLRRRELSERPTKPVRPEVLELRPLARRWGLFILTVALGEIVDKRVEVVLLDAFRSPHEVGVYAVAFSLAVVAMTVPSALAGALIPGIASAAASATDALRSHLLHAARVAWSAGFLLAAGVAAVGPTAVIVFWGSGLREAQQFVPWLALGVLFVPVPVLCGAYWTGTGRLAPVLLTTGVGAVVDLAVAGVLVPPYGIAGAVTANVAAQFVTCTLLVGYTQRRVSELGVSAGYLLRCAAVAAVAGLGGWGATAALAGTSPALALLAGIAAFVALVILTGLLVGLVPESDAEWLGGSLPAAARPALVVVGGRRWARSEPAGAVR